MSSNADGRQYVFQLKKPGVIANDASKRNVKGDDPVPPDRGTSIESLPLSNCHNLQWVTDIAIGTPFPQIFTVAIDTVAPLLLVPSADCDNTCDELQDLKMYEHENSESFKPVDEINEGIFEGPGVKGKFGADLVQIGPIQLEDQLFAQIESFNKKKFFSCESVDGVLGLNHMNMDDPKIATPIQSIGQNLKYPMFDDDNSSVKHHSEIIFGGVNQLHYMGCLQWYDLGQHKDEVTGDPFEGYWDFTLDHVKVGDKKLDKSHTSDIAIIDSNSANIIGPLLSIKEFAIANKMNCFTMDADNLKKEEVDCAEEEFDVMMVPCDSRDNPKFVPLRFFTDKGEYQIHLEDISERFYDKEIDKTICTPRLMPNPSLAMWIMGAPFLKRNYAVFDFGQKKIGLAPSALEDKTMCDDDTILDITYNKHKENIDALHEKNNPDPKMVDDLMNGPMEDDDLMDFTDVRDDDDTLTSARSSSFFTDAYDRSKASKSVATLGVVFCITFFAFIFIIRRRKRARQERSRFAQVELGDLTHG
eukprot:CAMPEP_0178979346 /NCGR_PEP_ID=MMETSP0789-20121207/25782_1 /TAXON_ID=3005 /ORGANISM="Rhizosolenia setigera, Strain CCMP 1694" /LENGTH=529 /DNA_ID=CAMNT_0020669423 /DNA_START=3 /DNA_END=1589 /DNA_ORIENTATION=+